MIRLIKRLAWLWYLRRNIDSRTTWDGTRLHAACGFPLPSGWVLSRSTEAINWLRDDDTYNEAYLAVRDRNKMMWG